MSRNSLMRRTVFLLAGLGLLCAAGLWRTPRVVQAVQDAPTATFSNTTPIVIADADAGGPGTANLYPSIINTTGLSGTVTDVNVTHNGLTHTWPDDLGLLLVGPGGQNIVLQSDVGTGNDVSNITYTIDDQATSLMPDSGTLTSGTFRPTSVINNEEFPAYSATITPPTTYSQSTPAGTATLNGIFGGSTPNGAWKLYVVDAFHGDTGSFSGGWSLIVTTSAGNAPTNVTNTPNATNALNAPNASFTNTTPITITDATT